MLDHIHIQNYRLFKDLKIDKLAQVNLIAGKNNTGKTALLEALRIVASKGESSVINNIIFCRGQWKINYDKENYSSLFKYVNGIFDNKIISKVLNKPRKESNVFDEHQVTIKINDFELGFSKVNDKTSLETGFYIQHKKSSSKITKIRGEVNPESPRDSLIYIPFLSHFFGFDILIDNLDIDKEKDIISILKIIEPDIEDFRFKFESKEPIIRLSVAKDRIPLKNLGDGINRLFTIALALVNAKDNILLIDEFEVGLHHSIQEQLWDIIFKYAKEWNIQVFVTTHSQDTVENFYYVANKSENKGNGQYFTLNKKSGNIVAVDYDMEEMKLALETNLEIR